MSRLPQGSDIQTNMSNAAIGMLYNTIPHPPITFLGPEYTFRQADGGNNNILEPDLGRAGTRYSRSAQPRRVMPAHGLPDPGLVFDTLLRRKGVSITLPFYMASRSNESLVCTEPSRTCKLYVRCCIYSHTPALPNVCDRPPYIIPYSFVNPLLILTVTVMIGPSTTLLPIST